MVIELDGSQHYEKELREYDAERTAFLGEYNVAVVRIDNREITKNFRGVCTYIDKVVKERIGDK